MKVPLSWLKDYVEIDIAPQELAERLTLAGMEVESIEYIGLPGGELPWDQEKIFVGQVRAVRSHPNADRLVLVEVDYGADEPEVVVTGAPSLLDLQGESDLNLKIAFALEGARLWNAYADEPQIQELTPTKIRGVMSRAMVCSEKELGLSDQHEDILYLPADAPVGTPLVDYLGDAVLSFDIKGPFGHLQSIFGIARETAALLDTPLKRDVIQVLDERPVELAPDPDFVELEIADPELCPRYSAAFIRGVEIGSSPQWMQLRLLRAGMRPINAIVDVTNYVMLELGQPLHAFDYDTLRARPGEQTPAIIIRRAKPGEKMATLDGVMRTYDEDMLLITDGEGPIAVAGVMGGQETEVSEATTDILLESANFNFLNVRRTSWQLGLSTEASQRFGRRLDPEMTVNAAARAAYLMADLAGGSVASTIGDQYPGRCEQTTIRFDPAQVTRILGVEVPADDVERILNSLEFEVARSASDELEVSVPSYRQDVEQPIDLVEEVGRVWGYDRFPRTLLRDELPPQRTNRALEGAERVRDLLIGCGLDEVITYSLVDLEEEGAFLAPGGESFEPEQYLRVRNPLSSERAYLRQTLLPSMLETARENLRFIDRVAIFEIGAVYLPVESQTLPDEPRRLAAVMTGPREPESWLEGQDRQPLDFYDMKGVVEAMLSRLGEEASFEKGQHPAFHPGRCAEVRIDEVNLGVMGELRPSVRESFGLPNQPICALEFDLDAMIALWGGPSKMEAISSHPAVYEDLALVVNEEVPAVRVRELIAQTGAPLLRSVVLFDQYRGEQIGAGKKSLAYRLTYQAEDRTLKDREVSKERNRIIRRLEREIGATLRT